MRMGFLNKSVDGLIAISRYLEEYYKDHVPTVYIPPLVDCDDPKWNSVQRLPHKDFNLVYAGSPGRKDRLDILVDAIEGEKIPIYLKIIGITKEQFHQQHPSFSMKNFTRITFLGHISHSQVLSEIRNADYSCFFRDQTRLTQAGFPTKFVESIAAGIPVITNENSNISEYRKRLESCIIIDDLSVKSVTNSIKKALNEKKRVEETNLFDYRKYIDKFSQIVNPQD
jgi:glycosyltransferase involved in cell wall biosynthesis